MSKVYFNISKEMVTGVRTARGGVIGQVKGEVGLC